MSNKVIKKRICMAVSPWTGKKCNAKAVGPNTLKKGTREFLDDRFCQMHQPGAESRKKCVCPHCHYHRSRDKNPMIQIDSKDPNKILVKQLQVDLEKSSNFGRKTSKKKKGNNNKKKQ